jgi:glycine cleavage system H protein
MLTYPDNLIYTNSHEYVRLEPGSESNLESKNDVAVIGITAFAIEQLGDVVYVDLPQIGSQLIKGDPFATVESVKAVGDIYAPLSGEVIAVNSDLVDQPEAIANDPYGASWLIKLKVEDASQLEGYMSAQQYRSKVEGVA